MDKIQLNGMVFYGFHGVTPAEQKIGQEFVVDLEVNCDLGVAAISDDIEDTVNYAEAYVVVKDVVESTKHKLIESVAGAIASGILHRFEIESVRVKVQKPHVSMQGGILEYAAVEIFREK